MEAPSQKTILDQSLQLSHGNASQLTYSNQKTQDSSPKHQIDSDSNKHTMECRICDQKYPDKQFDSICECQHKFCNTCSSIYLEYKIGAKQLIICPQVDCGQPVYQLGLVYSNIKAELKNEYSKFKLLNTAKNRLDLLICPTKNCNGTINIAQSTIKCLICNQQYCRNCFKIQHEGQCQNYQIQFFTKNFGFRQCLNCKIMIEKNQGCDHITCICGYQFCFKCSSEWSKDTCKRQQPSCPEITIQPDGPKQKLFKFFLKLLLLPLWSIVGILAILIPTLTFVSASVLSGVLIGSFKLVYDTINKYNTYNHYMIIIILLPFLMAAGVLVWMYETRREVYQIFINSKSFYVDTLEFLYRM